MNPLVPHGIYPPPNAFHRGRGSCDLRHAIIEASSSVPTWMLERLRETLRSVATGESSTRLVETKGFRISVRPVGVSHGARLPEGRIAPEGYRLRLTGSGTVLVADDARGLGYGVDTLCRLITAHEGVPPACEIKDAPAVPIRGVHLFLPAREDIPFFKRLLEMLSRYRYNTLYLQISAGMELERHPEINRAWERFVQELTAHPGGQKGLQESQWFDWKNDPHVDLAGGSWLTKDEVRDIVETARGYGIDVVPEIQTFAHAYWLTIAHPEIAEAHDDPFPDTICPSHPMTYELLFDVMDEIVEAMRPTMVHAGLDEAYTFRRCPLCEHSTGADIWAKHTLRIHEWLVRRGMGMGMWADKLLDITLESGERCGGVLRRVQKADRKWVMAPTAKALDEIPRDILLIDWYWGLDSSTPEMLMDKGFEKMIFGNLSATGIPDWQRLRDLPIVQGAEISTWTKASEDVLSRNAGLLNQFMQGACTLWWNDFDPAKHKAELTQAVQAGVPKERDFLGDRTSVLNRVRSGAQTTVPVDLTANSAWPSEGVKVSGIKPGVQSFGGIGFSVPEKGERVGGATVRWVDPIVRIPIEAKTEGLILLIGTSIHRPKRSRYEELHLGKDVVGRLHIHYGEELSPDRDYGVMDLVYGDTLIAWDDAPDSWWCDPVVTARAEGKDLTLHAVEWTNPKPDQMVRQVDLVWLGGRTLEGEISLLGLARTD